MVVELKDAELADIIELAKHMRAGDAAECRAIGGTPWQVAVSAWGLSFRRWAVRLDGQLMLVFGLAEAGTLCAPEYNVWLLTTTVADRSRVAFYKEVRRCFGILTQLRVPLFVHVHAEYKMAIRMLEALGFTVGPVVLLGPLMQPFRRATYGGPPWA